MTVAPCLTATNAPVRMGLGIVAGTAVLFGIAVVARPDMMMHGMRMIRGLVVGFGL